MGEREQRNHVGVGVVVGDVEIGAGPSPRHIGTDDAKSVPRKNHGKPRKVGAVAEKVGDADDGARGLLRLVYQIGQLGEACGERHGQPPAIGHWCTGHVHARVAACALTSLTSVSSCATIAGKRSAGSCSFQRSSDARW